LGGSLGTALAKPKVNIVWGEGGIASLSKWSGNDSWRTAAKTCRGHPVSFNTSRRLFLTKAPGTNSARRLARAAALRLRTSLRTAPPGGPKTRPASRSQIPGRLAVSTDRVPTVGTRSVGPLWRARLVGPEIGPKSSPSLQAAAHDNLGLHPPEAALQSKRSDHSGTRTGSARTFGRQTGTRPL
jgi:hypothetical protein